MLLYRGVDEESDLENDGEIKASGTATSLEPSWNDTKLRWDDMDIPIVDGPTQEAMIKYHQNNSASNSSAWISTTRNFDVAKRFATCDGLVDGWVYELDSDLFSMNGVKEQPVFRSPEHEFEEEISVRVEGGGPIPKQVIVRKIRIAIIDGDS